jgi:hypothetical protein
VQAGSSEVEMPLNELRSRFSKAKHDLCHILILLRESSHIDVFPSFVSQDLLVHFEILKLKLAGSVKDYRNALVLPGGHYLMVAR